MLTIGKLACAAGKMCVVNSTKIIVRCRKVHRVRAIAHDCINISEEWRLEDKRCSLASILLHEYAVDVYLLRCHSVRELELSVYLRKRESHFHSMSVSLRIEAAVKLRY